jgi:methanogenic corrinoid protein MtbC1
MLGSITFKPVYGFHDLITSFNNIQNGNLTGRLVCQNETAIKAFFYFEEGKIVHAVYGKLQGTEVFYALQSWESGVVVFQREEEVASADYEKNIRSIQDTDLPEVNRHLQFFVKNQIRNSEPTLGDALAQLGQSRAAHTKPVAAAAFAKPVALSYAANNSGSILLPAVEPASNSYQPDPPKPPVVTTTNETRATVPTTVVVTNRTEAEDIFGSKVDWAQIRKNGRQPYTNIAATPENFKGLQRAFERSAYTGMVEFVAPNLNLSRFYYLFESGFPLGLEEFDPELPEKFKLSRVPVSRLLTQPGFVLNVYLEPVKQNVEAYYTDYFGALQQGTFTKATEIIQKALDASLTPSIIYDDIFTPAMRDVGLMWERGSMTVAQEHLATGITEYCRNLVINNQVSKAKADGKTIGRVLLTSVAGNVHTLGLTLLSDIFRWNGWEVFPLFSPLPETEICESVFRYQVDLLCLSVALPVQIPKAASTVRALRQAGWKGIIEVGGGAFVNNKDAFHQTGADFLGGEAESTVREATRLLLEKQTA